MSRHVQGIQFSDISTLRFFLHLVDKIKFYFSRHLEVETEAGNEWGEVNRQKILAIREDENKRLNNPVPEKI